MKAWYLSVKDGDDGHFVVFADNRNAARNQADSKDLVYDRWIDIQAHRARKWDGLEKLSDAELNNRLWRDGWQWLEYAAPDPDETTDEDFYKWYESIFGSTK